MKHKIRTALFVSCAMLMLAGCGSSTTDRGLSGAAIGAAGGAIIGTVTGIGPAGGAAIGAAAGAATGAMTDSSEVNLGKPVWRGGDSSSAPPPSQANYEPAGSYDTETVRNIQDGLQRLGYAPGPADGVFGPQTEAAIRKYEQDNNLPIDGQPSASLWSQMKSRIQG